MCTYLSAVDLFVLPMMSAFLSRLRALLEGEEQQLLLEMEKMESMEEKKARMRERAQILRERREKDRKLLVAEKLEQHFR